MLGYVYFGAYGLGAIWGGEAAASTPTLSATARGKYKPEHDDSLLTMQTLDSFAPDHSGALSDIADAGV